MSADDLCEQIEKARLKRAAGVTEPEPVRNNAGEPERSFRLNPVFGN